MRFRGDSRLVGAKVGGYIRSRAISIPRRLLRTTIAMTESLSSRGDAQNIEFAHGLCMLLTAISGPSDELERARLIATGLPSLLSCHFSGVGLVDERATTWHWILQKDGRQVDVPQAERFGAELAPLFQEVSRRPALRILTLHDERDEARIPPSIQEQGIQSLVVAPLSQPTSSIE